MAIRVRLLACLALLSLIVATLGLTAFIVSNRSEAPLTTV